MSDFRLPLRTDYPLDSGEAWRECFLCGPRVYKALVHFTQGTVTPSVGETVTGASSGDTGVIVAYTIYSGSVATSDAAGVMELNTLTGYDSIQLDIFTAGESLNGSLSGNGFCVANKVGSVEVSGRLVPEKDTVEYEGRYYCKPHFLWKFRHTWEDDATVDYDESDREV